MFSTVGYGEFSPDIWLGQLFMILTITLAFVFIPSHIQGILATYMERVNCGGDYSFGLSKIKKHVIVCSTTLSLDSLIDFLNEFYGNPNLE
ncbi:slack isoform 2, partial [Biomphalaria glabrata]